MDRLFEMKDQEIGAQGTKYQVMLNFEICCRELGGGGSKLRVFARSCAVSAVSSWLMISKRSAFIIQAQFLLLRKRFLVVKKI